MTTFQITVLPFQHPEVGEISIDLEWLTIKPAEIGRGFDIFFKFWWKGDVRTGWQTISLPDDSLVKFQLIVDTNCPIGEANFWLRPTGKPVGDMDILAYPSVSPFR